MPKARSVVRPPRRDSPSTALRCAKVSSDAAVDFLHRREDQSSCRNKKFSDVYIIYNV